MPKLLLKNLKIKPRDDGPLWRGPESDHELGGVTQSMLCDFLTCRERFRVKYVLGLRPPDHFSHHLEYGQMWHACEEALAGFDDDGKYKVGKPDIWEPALKNYVTELLQRYPFDRDRVSHWYNVCKFQFPLYVDYWRKHPDVKNRTPLLQERVFRVPYSLPSGRVVHLRGKFDAVDLIDKGVWLQENKTKSDIDPVAIQRQVSFDLQTMMYLTVMALDTGIEALERAKGWDGAKLKSPIRGVRYNVVRRPLSGGKGSVVRHKAKVTKKGTTPEESLESYYRRAAQYVIDEPEHYFMRWKVDVSAEDVAKFRRECLDPILDQMCNWYSHAQNTINDKEKFGIPFSIDGAPAMIHWRHPFGVVNSIDEYGYSDLDEYLATGSEVGLRKVDTLFTELQ